jgi:hypothetical protein
MKAFYVISVGAVVLSVIAKLDTLFAYYPRTGNFSYQVNVTSGNVTTLVTEN